MKTQNDLTYLKKGFYTSFFADTPEGEEAYKEIVKVTGDNQIRNDHLKNVLKQLRKAGYKVGPAPKVTEKEINDIFNDELFKTLI